MESIGKNIKTIRIKNNLTQDQLAQKLFVTRQTVSNYETGKSQPDIDMLVKIRQVLQVDIDELITAKATERKVISKLEILFIIILWVLYWGLKNTGIKASLIPSDKMFYDASLVWTAELLIRPVAIMYTAYVLCKFIPKSKIKHSLVTNIIWYSLLVYAIMQITDHICPIINSFVVANGMSKAKAAGMTEIRGDMFSIKWLEKLIFTTLFSKIGINNFNLNSSTFIYRYKLAVPIYISLGRLLNLLKPESRHKNRVDS